MNRFGGRQKLNPAHHVVRLAYLAVVLLLGFVQENQSRIFVVAFLTFHSRKSPSYSSIILHDAENDPQQSKNDATCTPNTKKDESSSMPHYIATNQDLDVKKNGFRASGFANGVPAPSNGRAYAFHQNATAVVTANGKKSPEPKKGKRRTPKQSVQQPRIAPTAPEVNQWTTVMSDTFLRKRQIEESDIEQLYQDLKDMSIYDIEQVNVYWDRMLPLVSYLGTQSCAKIYDALRVAYRAHRGQMRKSGEPFIIHPVEVALLLTELKMDAESVMAGLLHDTVEDTALTFEEIQAMFGDDVRSIVEGETKVSKLPKLAFSDFADEQAENLRQMFVAMTEDYRIIVVKLADRLHNMRTLRHMKPEKQTKISRETLDIFAPLAHRMGIWQFKSELEDTAFMYLYPQEYKRLNRRLRLHQSHFRLTLDKSQDILRKTLDADQTLREQALDVQVFGRTKEIYSLWHKMEIKGERNLDRIVDVVALRVIITPLPGRNDLTSTPGAPENADDEIDMQRQKETRGVWLCYHVLGLVQHLPGFQPVPSGVKDYISFPKPNGYQSLHTALIFNGQTIEVQIRTSKMHQVAEHGMAAHWAYKESQRGLAREDLFNTPWLASIKEWQDDLITARDFVEAVRRELLGKRVFVFLRNGKILNLARGATVIDAAFQIHTEVGLNMHGVEINGKRVPFSYELRNGDVVSVLTGGGRPQTDWMRYAKIRTTRTKLRAYFRLKQKESLREAGKILIMDYLWVHKPLLEKSSYMYTDFDVPTTIEDLAQFLPGKSRYNEIDELLLDAGRKHDRAFLHQTISKIFYVSQNLLVRAEQKGKSFVPTSVVSVVQKSRKVAQDAAAAAEADDWASVSPLVNSTVAASGTISTAAASPFKSFSPQPFDWVLNNQSVVEYADQEHICPTCLPVHGDSIVGTRLEGEDSPVMVHRIGCQHAQRALNLAAAKAKHRNSTNIFKQSRFDSVTLRLMKGKTALSSLSGSQKEVREIDEVPVRLHWADCFDDSLAYMAEIVVIAQDRKLLLADCSEVVSELTTIVKTGSVTTNEHATLVFAVRVNGLDHLQKLMDHLGQIRSVMSVERRFGSDLL